MKDVMLRITGLQSSEQTGDDNMEFITEARLYERNGALYLIYDESGLSGVPGCRTRLRMRGPEVQLKRFGDSVGDGSEILFEKGKRFSGRYETPFGAIEMEVLTNDLKSRVSPEGHGSIDIDYDICLKGLLEGRNRISISFAESGKLEPLQ
ncbi:MAG: DUF1934 domain-containing protein [Clostridiales bacterium]|nr:DUF1934 domain-containing protein [Clostridiales bacterium]MDD7035156.1 DUF1934 domain-containing protein [Bacillota bacterium]MDY2920058.1 DUF1934 domain-containing protein [Lentihominibacter sp.]